MTATTLFQPPLFFFCPYPLSSYQLSFNHRYSSSAHHQLKTTAPLPPDFFCYSFPGLPILLRLVPLYSFFSCLSPAYSPLTPHLLPVNLYSSFLRQLQTFRPPTFNFSGSTQRPVSRFSLLFLFIPALTTFLRYFPSTLLFTFSSDVPSPTTTWPLHYPTLYFFHHPYFLTTLVHLLFRLLFPPLPPTTFAVPFFQCLFYAALPS